ncbi:XRE family transcriptional regulator [Anoxybacillus flavithermus]|uniref:XRE family transcriptional regulator n=1 Tax=Anoxybacillus flavithermus TaxID=33934 RepID=A0A094IX59_9BACL|nr:XRE family transcriptional regulator [Anoxybacillus flavithermus]
MNKEKIAQTLINLRGDRSREEVAKSIGISVSALQMYENGQRVPKDEIKIKSLNTMVFLLKQFF